MRMACFLFVIHKVGVSAVSWTWVCMFAGLQDGPKCRRLYLSTR